MYLKYLAFLSAGLLILSLVGCSSAGHYETSSNLSYSQGDMGTEAIAARPESSRQQRSQRPTAASRHASADRQPNAMAETEEATLPDVEPTEKKSRAQQLIYTGAVILAIYDVSKTQDATVELVEAMDGYISRRTSDRLVARVPAAKFRQALKEIGALGDVLDTTWEAEDVTDQMRDLDIRLRNSLELRNRLEQLLDQAESVEDALQIESELERITLEIERIRGSLQSFEDRIAYSTIEVSFRAKRSNDVPTDDFLLPFPWLNTLGLQSLMRSPEVNR